MDRAEMTFPGNPPGVVSIESEKPAEDKRLIVDAIDVLTECLRADVTIEPSNGLSETKYKAAFTEKEQALIRSKIFKLISLL